MNQDHQVEVFRSSNPIQIEVLRSYLQSEGISVFSVNEHQAAMSGVFPIKLMVPEDEAERASSLIDNPPGLPDDSEDELEND